MFINIIPSLQTCNTAHMHTGGNEPAGRQRVAPFHIDRSSGVVTTQTRLNRGSRPEHTFCVTVSKDANFNFR